MSHVFERVHGRVACKSCCMLGPSPLTGDFFCSSCKLCSSCCAGVSCGQAKAGFLEVGDAVKLSAAYLRESSASAGPLSPGEVGELLQIDESSMPYLVKGPSGTEFWYGRGALVLASCRHVFAVDVCRICTNCHSCTGYGGGMPHCRRQNRPDDSGESCCCGAGEAGCVRCGMCRTCCSVGEWRNQSERMVHREHHGDNSSFPTLTIPGLWAAEDEEDEEEGKEGDGEDDELGWDDDDVDDHEDYDSINDGKDENEEAGGDWIKSSSPSHQRVPSFQRDTYAYSSSGSESVTGQSLKDLSCLFNTSLGTSDTGLRVGNSVRVRPAILEPRSGWGGATPSSVGILRSIGCNDVEIDFAEHSGWCGYLDEIERVEIENLAGKLVMCLCGDEDATWEDCPGGRLSFSLGSHWVVSKVMQRGGKYFITPTIFDTLWIPLSAVKILNLNGENSDGEPTITDKDGFYVSPRQLSSSQQDAGGLKAMFSILGFDARANWQSRDRAGLDSQRLFPLNPMSPEYRAIEAEFHRTLSARTIDAVERVENGPQHELYSVHRHNVEREIQPDGGGGGLRVGDAVRLLFHGTSADAVQSIIHSNTAGFLPLLAGTTTGAIYGDGTYFARDADYSDGYAARLPTGQRQMLVVEVAVGRWTVGRSGMKQCPLILGERYRRFNSLADQEEDPAVFVVQHGSQAYPAYLITYH